MKTAVRRLKSDKPRSDVAVDGDGDGENEESTEGVGEGEGEGEDLGDLIKREEDSGDEAQVTAPPHRSPEVVVLVPKREHRDFAQYYEPTDHSKAPRTKEKKRKQKNKNKKRSLRNTKWSAEDDEKLLRGLKKGYSFREIRKKLGFARSEGAIRRRKHHLGL